MAMQRMMQRSAGLFLHSSGAHNKKRKKEKGGETVEKRRGKKKGKTRASLNFRTSLKIISHTARERVLALPLLLPTLPQTEIKTTERSREAMSLLSSFCRSNLGILRDGV
jgi:hypothetical protein